MTDIDQFADDLERHLLGIVDAHFIRGQYERADNPDISILMSSVEHFLSDSDIRTEDTAYCKMQKEEMMKLIKLLRYGRINDARRISFLHESKVV